MGFPFKYDGPNCWNTALRPVLHEYAGGEHPRYTHSTEFTSWLESPLCEQIPERKHQYNSSRSRVIAMREQSGEEVHGYLKCSAKGAAFHKPGSSKLSLIEHSLQKSIRDLYNFDDLDLKEDEYSCMHLSEYLNRYPILNKPVFLDFLSRLKYFSGQLRFLYQQPKSQKSLVARLESEILLTKKQFQKWLQKNKVELLHLRGEVRPQASYKLYKALGDAFDSLTKSIAVISRSL